MMDLYIPILDDETLMMGVTHLQFDTMDECAAYLKEYAPDFVTDRMCLLIRGLKEEDVKFSSLIS